MITIKEALKIQKSNLKKKFDPTCYKLAVDSSGSNIIDTISGEVVGWYKEDGSTGYYPEYQQYFSKTIGEEIEKHNELNPKLFENNKLKPEVKEKILNMVEVFLDDLKFYDVKINIQDIILTGSNCSYNYNKNSDLDIHIVAETKSLGCPQNLYPKLYSAYSTLFNRKMDIDFYGIPVEMYVETEDDPVHSNGIYSVKENKWIKEPVAEDIPEVDKEVFDKEFKVWEDRYNDIIDSGKKELKESVDFDEFERSHREYYRKHPYSYEAGRLELVRAFKEEAKKCPYLVISTHDWYDPEGLDIPNKSYTIWFGGTEDECKQKIKKIAAETGKDNVIEKEGDNFVTIYYPHAISRSYYSVIKNDKLTNESLTEKLENKQVEEIDKFLTDLYQLRKEGLSKEGEYSIGNLVFKEIRNKGYLDELKDLKNQLTGKELSLESLNESFNQCSPEEIKRVALKYVKDSGYMSGGYGYHNNNGTSYRGSPTASEIYSILNKTNVEELESYMCSEDEYRDLEHWAHTIDIDNVPTLRDYYQKVLSIWNKPELEKTDISMIASLCNNYLKNLEYRQCQQARMERNRIHQQEVDSEDNAWAGQVGDQIEFEVASAEIKTWIQPGSYYANSYPLYEIKDVNNRVYTWGSTQGPIDIKAGDIITAKIKELREFRGIKQTRLTNVKINGNKPQKQESNLEEDFKKLDIHYEWTKEPKVDENGREYHGHVISFATANSKTWDEIEDVVYIGITKEQYLNLAMDLATETSADMSNTTTRSGVISFKGTKDLEWNDDFTYKIRYKSKYLNRDFFKEVLPPTAGEVLFNMCRRKWNSQDFCDVVIVKNDGKQLTSDPSIMTCYPATRDSVENLIRTCNQYVGNQATADENVKDQMLILADPCLKDQIKFRVIKPTNIHSHNTIRKNGIDNYTKYNEGTYLDLNNQPHSFKVEDNINAALKNKDDKEYSLSSRNVGEAKNVFRLAAAKEIFNNEKQTVDNFRQRYVNDLICVWTSSPRDASDFISNEPRLKDLIERVYGVREEDDYDRYHSITNDLCNDVYRQWKQLDNTK